ncbi:hypothetical protein BJX76DRAFT_65598 [Aspergillus varians]
MDSQMGRGLDRGGRAQQWQPEERSFLPSPTLSQFQLPSHFLSSSSLTPSLGHRRFQASLILGSSMVAFLPYSRPSRRPPNFLFPPSNLPLLHPLPLHHRHSLTTSPVCCPFQLLSLSPSPSLSLSRSPLYLRSNHLASRLFPPVSTTPPRPRTHPPLATDVYSLLRPNVEFPSEITLGLLLGYRLLSVACSLPVEP